MSAGQEEVNAIGLVTIRQRSFPGDIRLIESNRQTRGQTVETDRIGPGAVKIIVRGWVICRIVKRIARNPGDFARTQIVNKIFLRKLASWIVTVFEGVVIHTDSPNQLELSVSDRGQ